jgi:hypothetical protein
MAALSGHYKLAETVYLEQGQTDAAMAMYQTLHKWDEAIIVAEARNHPNLDEMRASYSQWLTETGQEEKAGEMREVRLGSNDVVGTGRCLGRCRGLVGADKAHSCCGPALPPCIPVRSNS